MKFLQQDKGALPSQGGVFLEAKNVGETDDRGAFWVFKKISLQTFVRPQSILIHICKTQLFTDILVQTPHIEKLMSYSCSATPKTPRNVFLRKKNFKKMKILGPQF